MIQLLLLESILVEWLRKSNFVYYITLKGLDIAILRKKFQK